MTLSGAEAIAYDYLEPDEEYYRERFNEEVEQGFLDEDEDFDNWMWSEYSNGDAADEFQSYLEWVQDTVIEQWTSFEKTDEWVGNENHVIAQNAHSIVTISEYSGCVAICLGARYDRDGYWEDSTELANLGAHWRKQIANKFEERFSTLNKIATFSNGESVYTKVS
jgi:hypothetical protein